MRQCCREQSLYDMMIPIKVYNLVSHLEIVHVESGKKCKYPDKIMDIFYLSNIKVNTIIRIKRD